jgi:2'-deoxynucleoside 5'-phosphate N-hydrolase
MTAYIAISFNKRQLLKKELRAIRDCLEINGITPFVFADNYKFNERQEKEMMQQAMDDIKRCDLLIAETSEKAIGVGIEAGYAKANNKPIIYMRQNETEHSTTVSGISDYQVIYSDINDLQIQLTKILKEGIANLHK